MRYSNSREHGGTFFIVLATAVVLSLVAAQVLRMASAKYRSAMNAASWQEAVYSAEAGVDVAVAALRDSAWQNWEDGAGNGASGPPPASPDATPAPSDIRVWDNLLSRTTGQGGSNSALLVQIDAPAALSDANGQWYRVRSTGVAELPGNRRVGYEARLFFSDGTRQSAQETLRRFALFDDQSGGLLADHAQAVRTIEAIIKPVTRPLWLRPFTLGRKIDLDQGSLVDSFDSSDQAKSTNGLYDVTKRQLNGNIGLVDNDKSDLRDEFVYGDVQYNNTQINHATNVQGTISSPFNETIDPVCAPNWSTFNAAPTVIKETMALSGGPAGSPARYKVSELTISGGKSLTFQPHAAGEESYIEIWVTGKMATTGDGFIEQPDGVHVTYYVEDDISVVASSLNNQSNLASNLQIYGVTPASGTKKLTISGNGTFIGAVNAPDFDIAIPGIVELSGAFIGYTVNMNGGGHMHYDEALRGVNGPGPLEYRVISWAEDVR